MAVFSVNGKTGIVVLNAIDIPCDVPTGITASANVQAVLDAIAELAGEPGTIPTDTFLYLSTPNDEPEEGASGCTMIVVRSGLLSVTTTVDWSTVGVGADPANAADFTGAVFPSGSLTFAPNETQKSFTITFSDDIDVEADETFNVVLANPVNASIVLGTLQITILTDDVDPIDPVTLLDIEDTSAWKAEGSSAANFTFTVTRAGPTNGTTTCDWDVRPYGDYPAEAADFTGAAFPSGSLSFTAGQTTKTITISVVGDATQERDQQFVVWLTDAADTLNDCYITTERAFGQIEQDEVVADIFELPNWLCVFSFYEVLTTAPATCITLRRPSDNDIKTFNFNANPAVMFQAIFNWSFPDIFAYVVKWFDQSASGNHLVQPVFSEQPKLDLENWSIDFDDVFAQTSLRVNNSVPITYTAGSSSAPNIINTISMELGPWNQPWTMIAAAVKDQTGPMTLACISPYGNRCGLHWNANGAPRFSSDGGLALTGSRTDGLAVYATACSDFLRQDLNINGTEVGSSLLGGSGPIQIEQLVLGAGNQPEMRFRGRCGFFAIALEYMGGVRRDAFAAWMAAYVDFVDTPLSGAEAIVAITTLDSVKPEGQSGTTNYTFTVERSGDTAGTSSCTYTVSGTGVNPADAADFSGGTFPTGSLSWVAAETSKTLTIVVVGETRAEQDETFRVTLSAPVDCTIDGSATFADGTIEADEVAGAYLDQITWVAVYSSKKLVRIDYGGALIRVEYDDGASTEEDIYPDDDGDLDTAYIAGRITSLSATKARIRKLYDQSGNGKDLSQATDGLQPKIDTTLGCISFADAADGTNRYVNISPAISHSQPFTYFLNFKRNGSASPAALVNNSSSSGRGIKTTAANTVTITQDGTAVTNATIVDANWTSLSCVFDGVGSNIRVDNAAPVTGSVGVVSVTGPVLGGSGNSGFRSLMLCDFFGIVAGAVSTSDRNDVHTWMDGKLN